MPFRITMTEDAEAHLRALTARQQALLKAAVPARLQDRPTTPTRAIKKLRPNPLVEYEPRVGDLRVLYNVEGSEVVLVVIGEKVGNKLVVRGEEFHGHQDDPPQQPSGGTSDDAE